MSRRHRPALQRGSRRDVWLTTTAAVAVVLVIVLFAASRLSNRFFERRQLTAAGQILETRIVVDHVFDGDFGGLIFYRIEARVRFETDGTPQDRWMTASEVTSERDILAARLVSAPKTCQVTWSPGHEENARCRLP